MRPGSDHGSSAWKSTSVLPGRRHALTRHHSRTTTRHKEGPFLAVYNLASPNRILEPCDLKDLPSWFRTELTQLQDSAERKVLDTVGENLDVFVRWPERPLLLWPECDRTPPPGKKHKYFKYPPHIKDMARAIRYTLDGRPNGPAIAAFCIAGGTRPERF